MFKKFVCAAILSCLIACPAIAAALKTYHIALQYSKNGKSWANTSVTVKAESDVGAISQIESKYPYVRNVRILNVR